MEKLVSISLIVCVVSVNVIFCEGSPIPNNCYPNNTIPSQCNCNYSIPGCYWIESDAGNYCGPQALYDQIVNDFGVTVCQNSNFTGFTATVTNTSNCSTSVNITVDPGLQALLNNLQPSDVAAANQQFQEAINTDIANNIQASVLSSFSVSIVSIPPPAQDQSSNYESM